MLAAMHAHATDTPLRLITVSFSHFCEKARWALDRADLAYREESHVPMISWPATFGAGGGRTVPVLVAPDRVLPDSTDILRWVDEQSHAPRLFPHGDEGAEVARWEDDFDRGLGPASRRMVYAHVLARPELGRKLLGSAGGRWQRRVSDAIYPLLGGMIRRGLGVNPAGVLRSRHVVEDTFARVAERLAGGRRYLVGDRLTAADLTFAALATPVLAPEPFVAAHLAELGEMPAELAAMVAHYRATPAGEFALRLYAEERQRRMC
jgi:glutathione S-transferase